MTHTAPSPVPRPGPPRTRRTSTTPARASSIAPTTGINRGPDSARRWDTPTRLRIATAVSVLAALLAAVLGWQAGERQAAAVGAVSTSSARLVAVQEVHSSLVGADAIATNAFLVGGLEPPVDRERYTALVDQAAKGLATLSFADAVDTAHVAAATAHLATYTGLVEQARAANRQGFPVGAAYLDQASTLMRDHLLVEIDALTGSGADHVAADFDQVANTPWLLVAVLLGLAALLATQVWDSRRTHRILNPALSGGVAVVVVAAALSPVLLGVTGTAGDVRTGSYRTALAVSQALSQAYDARAMESFTLIRRGSGAAYEQAFGTAADETERQLARVGDGSTNATAKLFTAWRAQHVTIRKLDDGGNWEGAVALTGSTSTGSPAAAFDAFTTSASGVLKHAETSTTDRLARARTTAVGIGRMLAAAGLVAAGLSWLGLTKRLEEYR